VEPLTLYFDRNVGKRLPEALRLLQLHDVKNNVIHHHSEKRSIAGMRYKNRTEQLFKPEEKDDQWLEFVGKKNWIVFSQDRKFHTAGYENEMFALKQFNVGCFYLWGADARCADKALAFLKAYDKIVAAIQTTPKPFIYDLAKSGKLTRIDIARALTP
jgi:hypothetical protein